MMDASRLFELRRSIRKFRPSEIPDEALTSIVDYARLAPTARNVQPWEFIVVKNKQSLKMLGELCSPNGILIKDASACITIVCSDTKYYLEDGSAATTYALLAAAVLGLGSCWIAGDKKDYCQKVKDYLSIPKEYRLISLIALGYPDESPTPNKRKLNDVLHREKF